MLKVWIRLRATGIESGDILIYHLNLDKERKKTMMLLNFTALEDTAVII